tara:strand:+ start:90 stop:254 length:165 start_codon:yes stop_codon:yes gene_type:complete
MGITRGSVNKVKQSNGSLDAFFEVAHLHAPSAITATSFSGTSNVSSALTWIEFD